MKTTRTADEGGCYQAGGDETMSFAQIVADYKKRGLPRARRELDRFQLHRKLPSLKDAIRAAALSRNENGQPYSHQRKNWNFWPEGIPKAMNALVNAADMIEACSDFDELHELVTDVIAGVTGVGKLYAYDVSLRIGAWCGYWPTKVYLHTGTEVGAKNLWLDISSGALDMTSFPLEFQELEPYQVEDVLCHYKDAFPSA